MISTQAVSREEGEAGTTMTQQNGEDEGAGRLALSRSCPTLPRWLKGLIALTPAIAGLGLYVVNQEAEANNDDAVQALEVVTGHVEELLSYDFRNVQDELAAERKWLTGSFESKYAELVTKNIAPRAVESEVTTNAEVQKGAVVSTGQDDVELLLFVNVTTKAKTLETPKVSGSRLVVKAKFVDGTWRITALDPV